MATVAFPLTNEVNEASSVKNLVYLNSFCTRQMSFKPGLHQFTSFI